LVVPEVAVDGVPVSSSRIRACLEAGEVRTAAALLGRPYALDAIVVHGKKLGRTIGFPTANQYFPPERMIPAYGVYATRCYTPYGVFTGVSNVGEHPTVDAHARVNCETYILGLSHNLYGKRIRVEFLEYLRPERRFASLEELTDAIRRDADTARRLLDGK
jgi:riboflavin kinase/FMN adenylyltransferase